MKWERRKKIILLNGNIKIERWEHSQFSIHRLFALCISKKNIKIFKKKEKNSVWRIKKNQVNVFLVLPKKKKKRFREKENKKILWKKVKKIFIWNFHSWKKKWKTKRKKIIKSGIKNNLGVCLKRKLNHQSEFLITKQKEKKYFFI